MSPGDLVLERYRIERLLGRGGMGSVYEATELETGRVVAVKLMHARTARDQARFRIEADAARKCRHTHVVELLAFAPGPPAIIVMELARGETLAELLRRGAPALPRVRRLADQLLDAVQAMADAGVVHRDLKPSNIVLAVDAQGRETLKVLDFGIAKPVEHGKLTESGVAVGTLPYMAPEQLALEVFGPSIDVFAAALVIYELLCGRRAYPSTHPIELMQSVLHARIIDLHVVAPHVPADVCAVVMRALRPDPAARFASAAEFAEALRRASPPPRFNWATPLLVAGLGGFALAGGIVYVSSRPQPDATTGTHTKAPERGAASGSDTTSALPVAVSREAIPNVTDGLAPTTASHAKPLGSARPLDAPCTHMHQCDGLAHCLQGRCACPSYLLHCNGTCVQRNRAHCTSCEPCPNNSRCSATSDPHCEPCGPGEIVCGENCVNAQTTNFHCGTCGHTCTPSETCREGKCVVVASLGDACSARIPCGALNTECRGGSCQCAAGYVPCPAPWKFCCAPGRTPE
jgi:hypothetical protein